MTGIVWLDVVFEITGIVWWISVVGFAIVVAASFKVK